jgi:hypothetical protein
MALYVLTVTDTTGKRLPGCAGPTNEIAVYSNDELKQRLNEAKKNPQWRGTHWPAPESRTR